MTATVGFSGDVAAYYARFRRGYPAQVLDNLQEFFALTPDDGVLDLGCGTGQLAVPLASRVRSVIGMDPEPDMLRHARESATEQGVGNATWVLGADTDIPALGAQLGSRSLAMAVVGQALHWMRHDDLFGDLFPLFRPGGGIAVVANGTPLWQTGGTGGTDRAGRVISRADWRRWRRCRSPPGSAGRIRCCRCAWPWSSRRAPRRCSPRAGSPAARSGRGRHA